jgi:ribosomal-protein-alanine N-acetyltransferase
MILRGADGAEAPALARLHVRAFDHPWSEDEFAELLAGAGAFALAAEAETGLVGFVLCRALAGEAEILTLAVDPAARRRGVARALLAAAVAASQAAGAETLFLEVAADNAAAIGLYTGARFVRAGARPGYYARGEGVFVDAAVMRLDLKHEHP